MSTYGRAGWVVAGVLLRSGIAQDANAPGALGPIERAVASGVMQVTRADDGLEVHVVRRATEDPVPGALVAALDFADLLRRRIKPEEIANDASLLLERGAIVVRADQRGVARVPRRFGSTMLIAEAGGGRGLRSADGGGRYSVDVSIAPPTSLRIVTVDQQGAPRAGVPVGFKDRTEITSAPDGVAVLRDLELNSDLWSSARTKETLDVRIQAPIVDLYPHEVDLSAPPREPLKLVVPPSAALNVRVVDAGGRVMSIDGDARLDLYVVATHHDYSDATVELGRDGTATFPIVPLRSQLRLKLLPFGHEESSVEVETPAEDGRAVAVDVPIGNAHRCLVGRAVTQDGRRVDAGWLAASLESTDAAGTVAARRVEPELDDAGVFRIDLDRSEVPPSARPAVLRLVTWPAPLLESRAVVLAGLPEVGTVSLGDVAFDAPPIRARGIVVDDDGHPIERAFVHAKDPAAPKESLSASAFAESGEDGRFELRTSLLAPLEVTAGYPISSLLPARSEAVQITDAEREVRLVIPRPSALEGSLPAVPEVPNVPLSLCLISESGRRERLESTKIAADGTFRFSPLVAGRYRIEALLAPRGKDGEIVATVDDIVVRSGETTHDPRLNPLDPWKNVRTVEVSVWATDRVPVPLVEATTLLKPDGSPSDWTIQQLGHVVRLPTAQERVDVVLRAGESRPLLVPDVTDGRKVKIELGIPVRFVVGALPPDLSGKILGQLSLIANDRRFPEKWRRIERPLRNEREIEVRAPLPGRYYGRVGFRDDPSDRGLDMRWVQPVTVVDSDDEQTIELVIDPKRNPH